MKRLQIISLLVLSLAILPFIVPEMMDAFENKERNMNSVTKESIVLQTPLVPEMKMK